MPMSPALGTGSLTDPRPDAELTPVLETVAALPEKFLETARLAPGETSERLEEASRVVAPSAVALIDPESVAAAAVGLDGQVLAASATFVDKGGPAILELEAISQAARSSAPIVRAVQLCDGRSALPGLVVYGAAKVSRDWQLPGRLRGIVDRVGAVAVIASFAPSEGPLARAAGSFGLTALQSRVCAAILATGNLKAAAERSGLSYATAREAAAEAMARMGVRKLPELVTEMARLAYGVLPAGGAEALLVDLWGITLRQATLASLIAHGFTREQAARTLGISLAVAKKEIVAVYQALSVSSAAGLAISLAGMAVVAAMLAATGGSVGALEPRVEPLRFALRADGTRIAYSDYGPASGRPVLLVHSSMTSRIASRALVACLQRAGFRPVSIDRPGFGLTDMIDDVDPFEAAAADVIHLSGVLRIKRWAVVARGGAQAVLALQRSRPELLGRVVLVNPDPHTTSEGRRQGPLGAFKELYWRNPAIVGAVARIVSSQLTLPRLRRLLASAVAGSPPDEAALDLPGLVEDYHRSVRMFATGRTHGYVAEQLWFARPPADASRPVEGTRNWRLLVAEHDTLHDPAQVARYWQDLLPDAHVVCLPDHGRLLAMADPGVVVRALDGSNFPS